MRQVFTVKVYNFQPGCKINLAEISSFPAEKAPSHTEVIFLWPQDSVNSHKAVMLRCNPLVESPVVVLAFKVVVILWTVGILKFILEIATFQNHQQVHFDHTLVIRSRTVEIFKRQEIKLQFKVNISLQMPKERWNYFLVHLLMLLRVILLLQSIVKACQGVQ